jgi:hypothetical protein
MRTLVVAAAASLTAGAAFAQTAPVAAKSGGNFDPNEVVCRSIRESGSRLRTGRVCMTRGQWADWRREQRFNTEQSQNRRVAPR